MGRRKEPDESSQHARAVLLLRLVDQERLGFYDAELWLRAWEAKAEAIGRRRASEGYWDEGWRWISGELAAKRRQEN
ncbi:MAG: hypothetical protein WEE66_04535 [Actinomycetota bacterium]